MSETVTTAILLQMCEEWEKGKLRVLPSIFSGINARSLAALVRCAEKLHETQLFDQAGAVELQARLPGYEISPETQERMSGNDKALVALEAAGIEVSHA